VVCGELGEGLYFAFAEDVPEADSLVSINLYDFDGNIEYPGSPILDGSDV